MDRYDNPRHYRDLRPAPPRPQPSYDPQHDSFLSSHSSSRPPQQQQQYSSHNSQHFGNSSRQQDQHRSSSGNNTGNYQSSSSSRSNQQYQYQSPVAAPGLLHPDERQQEYGFKEPMKYYDIDNQMYRARPRSGNQQQQQQPQQSHSLSSSSSSRGYSSNPPPSSGSGSGRPRNRRNATSSTDYNRQLSNSRLVHQLSSSSPSSAPTPHYDGLLYTCLLPGCGQRQYAGAEELMQHEQQRHDLETAVLATCKWRRCGVTKRGSGAEEGIKRHLMEVHGVAERIGMRGLYGVCSLI